MTFTDCPIIELKPAFDGIVVAVVPPFRGLVSVSARPTHEEADTIALGETLAGLLRWQEGRPGVSVHPVAGEGMTVDRMEAVALFASQLYRTDLKFRGVPCSTCGLPC